MSDKGQGDQSEFLGRDIICLSFVPWEDHWGTPQQLLSRMLDVNRVLFIDPPVSIMSFFTGRGLRIAAHRWKRWLEGVRHIEPNLYVVTPPPVFPFRYRWPFSALNAVSTRRWLKRVSRQLGFRSPVIWNFEPTLTGVGSAIEHSLLIYHCVDDFSSIPHWWNSASDVIARDAECCREADLVICTGQNLANRRMGLNPNTHFVPNAGDVELFATAASPETAIPTDIAALPKPVIGLYGAIDFRVDVGTLTYLARQRPDWSVAIVGIVKGGLPLGELQSLPNVTFFGWQPRELLPGYIKGMDVCLVAYTPTEYGNHIFPQKLFDYMAAGKPIVATAIAELRPLAGDLLAVAETRDEFCHAVAHALANDSPELEQRRRELATTNSWEDRVSQITDLILATGVGNNSTHARADASRVRAGGSHS